MDAEIKAKWVEALRSGRFRQGSHYLRVGEAYCCLGVLCDVAGAKWESDPYGTHPVDGSYARFDGVDATGEEEVPGEVARRLGLSWDQQKILWTMNDDDRRSFAEIADYIEAHL